MTKIYPALDQYDQFPTVTNASVNPFKRQAAMEEVDADGQQAFIDANPNFYRSAKNAQLLVQWCRSRAVPTTLWNLTIALRDLTENGLLETAPPPEAPPVDKSRGIVYADNRIAEYVPSDAEAAALEAVKDDPNLSDAERKRRDRKLKRLATEDRLSSAGVDQELPTYLSQ